MISFKEISTGGVQISSVKLPSEPAKSQETDEDCPLKTRIFALRAVFQFSQQFNLPVRIGLVLTRTLKKSEVAFVWPEYRGC